MTQGGAACAGCEGGVADDPPAKRKRASRVQRARRAKAARIDGGFIRRAATAGYTPSQEARDCLHVAVSNLTGIAYSELVQSLPPRVEADTRFADMGRVLRERGWSMVQVTTELLIQGGPLLNLMRRRGLYIALFRITHKTDPGYEGSRHCLAYDGKALIADRGRYPMRELEEADREIDGAVKAVEDFTPRRADFWRDGRSQLRWTLTNVYCIQKQ